VVDHHDHGYFGWSPLPTRAPRRWPDGARVAVSVVVDLGAVEWEQPADAVVVPPLGGRGRAPFPDFPRMSHREFGHRVGIFRLLDVLRAAGIAPAAVVDVLTAEHYEPLVRHLRPAVAEFVAGGLSATRAVTSLMTHDEERHYIATTLDRLHHVLGVRPAGWRSPEGSESARTPALLADAGIEYVADWCNDEQPYTMRGPASGVWAFPLSWELSDVSAMFVRQQSPWDYARTLTDAFDVMCADGETSGRVLAIHLHPWLSGQAFRAAAIENALCHIAADERAWVATPRDIVEWCRVS
jgi:peptidoglycan/xylan/chitin deacetylase (PgdA/CDA1 family)